MLTREVENAMVKCGSYWTNTEYGPLRLELLSTSPPTSASASMTTDTSKQGFFAIREPHGETGPASRGQSTLITRVFALSHTSYPGVPPRRITHLQYLDWSDMNVPDDPRGVLDLIRRVEQAVAESTPGPSPGGSLSPGSAGGSLSGSQSPDVGPDQKGHDLSLLSPTSVCFMPGGGMRRRGGCEWRHPELDPKTGIAAFALGKAAPVLLHCSAGVGRTGGFIAVDAVLDGIRRELQKRREEMSLQKASCVRVVSTEDKIDTNDVEADGEFSPEDTEAGANSVESSGKESASDGSERMDVDEPAVDKAEETRDPLHGINTVPIHVSAGDRTKGRRRYRHSKDASGPEKRSSSESLVVHVPYVETDGAPEETNVTGVDLGDPKEAGWQSTSTREWAEQVSDQTHAHAEEGEQLPPPSLPLSNRERSPGSASNSSGPSALNSVDESVNGSVGGGASGSASGSGSENKVEWKSSMGSGNGSGSGSASGSGRPSPSLVSKPGSGSMSLSNSGSGTGTSSRLGSSLLRVRLRDSSVTSISAGSTDSLSPKQELKLNAPLHRSSLVIHTSSSSDMEIDCPPRPVPAPLQPTHSSPVVPPGRAEKVMSFDGDATDGSVPQPSSGPGSDASPPQGFVSGPSANVEGSGKNGQVLFDGSEESAVPSKSRSNLRLNTELSSLRVPATIQSSRSAKSPPLPSRESRSRERSAIPPVPHVPNGPASPAPGAPRALGHDQRNADHPVIDYKLPRELHSELSPPLISSFAEPICTVIQDMREQRMSLCQSLRQYVFVHAAIIEGTLRIVDEERELWGSAGTSDESSEGEPGMSGRQSGYSEGPKGWFGPTDKGEVTVVTPEHEHGTHRHLPLHIVSPPPNYWSSEAKIGGAQVPLAPTSSSSGVSSPSKGKRGPSPTELLKEDKTGALSLNKRPSILRQTSTQEGDQVSFELSRISPVTSEDGGKSRDAIVGMSANQLTPGQPGVPEKGGSGRAIFE